MHVEKMIVTATFPDISCADLKKGESGTTKEALFAEMQARHCDKFAFITPKPQAQKDQR